MEPEDITYVCQECGCEAEREGDGEVVKECECEAPVGANLKAVVYGESSLS